MFIKTHIGANGVLNLENLPFPAGTEIDVLITERQTAKPISGKELLQSDAIGMWEGREDIKDGYSFSRKLRAEIESQLKGLC
jgi:hypothetical protein